MVAFQSEVRSLANRVLLTCRSSDIVCHIQFPELGLSGCSGLLADELDIERAARCNQALLDARNCGRELA
jgi:hypothetical protein